jgi:hypothetical protein
MMRLRNILVPLLIAGSAFAATPALTGCYATGSAYVVEEAPPPPRHEVVVYRPGYIWVRGHWTRPGGRWAWRSGYYERARANAVYVDGRWERRGRGHVWVDGGWRARGRVVVR